MVENIPMGAELRVGQSVSGWTLVQYLPQLGLREWKTGWLPSSHVQSYAGLDLPDNCLAEKRTGIVICANPLPSSVSRSMEGRYIGKCLLSMYYEIPKPAWNKSGRGLVPTVECSMQVNYKTETGRTAQRTATVSKTVHVGKDGTSGEFKTGLSLAGGYAQELMEPGMQCKVARISLN